MLGDIVMIEDQEEKKSKLNNQVPDINRGFELMIRSHNREEKSLDLKTFKIIFSKMISLFCREFYINFEFSFGIKKSNSQRKRS